LNKHKIIAEFVSGKIKALDEDTSVAKAALAKLRRGVGKEPGELSELWDVVLANMHLDLLSDSGQATEAQWAIYTSLTLYALHRQGKNTSMNDPGRVIEGKRIPGKSLGAAARKLIEPDKSNEQSIKRRFDAITTAQDMKELVHYARGLVQLLRAANPSITMDYQRFAKDLYSYQFNESRNRVRLRWGQDFWAEER